MKKKKVTVSGDIGRHYLVVINGEVAYGPLSSGEADAMMTGIELCGGLGVINAKKMKRTDVDTQSLAFGTLNYHKVEEE
jgi:hypothetical protein